VSMTGHDIIAFANGSSVLSQILLVDPAYFTRLVAPAGAFEFYRFSKLRFRIHPAAVQVAASYLPEATTTTATYANIIHQPRMAHLTGAETTPSPWINIPRGVLLGTATKWFKTQTATGTDPSITQGTLMVATASSAAATNTLEFEYVCQFRGGEASGLQPLLPRQASSSAASSSSSSSSSTSLTVIEEYECPCKCGKSV